jgi:transcriptional regulator with XRE-family HTH domain
MDLKAILEQATDNKSQRALAEELGIARSTLTLILNGHRNAGRKVIMAMIHHPATREATLNFLSRNVTSVNINSNEPEQ